MTIEGRKRGRRRSGNAAVLAAALLVSGTALAFVAVRGPEPPSSLPERVHAVASTLRCPVCQNLSVADSPSPLARQMRTTIGRELQAGRSPEQIKSRFVQAYGEWILLAPPRRGLNLIAWIAPALLLAGGAVAAVVAVRRWTTRRSEAAAAAHGGAGAESAVRDGAGLTADDRRMLEHALAALPEDPA